MLLAYGRLLGRIGALERVAGIALIFLIVVAITAQVFTRYVLNMPIAWVEESATYAFIWMVFIGASVGLKESRHILIQTFVDRLPPRGSAAVRTLIWLLVLALMVVLVMQGFKVMDVEGRSRTISLPVEIPRMWFYSVPLTLSAASMALTSVYLLLVEATVLFGGARPRRAEAAMSGASQ